MNNKKQDKGTQIFGTQSIDEHAGMESNLHHVKNVTVRYDKELFRNAVPRPLTVVRVCIEFEDGIHPTPLYHTMTLFCDNPVWNQSSLKVFDTDEIAEMRDESKISQMIEEHNKEVR